MHLLIPFAAPASEAARQALRALQLPQLEKLLAGLRVEARDDGDETLLSPPHERARARLLGLRGGDGLLPWAAHDAALAGIDPGGQAWSLLTPVHLQVGVDQVSLLDPDQLALDHTASRTLFDAVQGLFASEGFTMAWLGPLRWLAAHPSLHTLATASLDRVIGRGIDGWLPPPDAARLIRRLQNEVQMLLHGHPVNEQRLALGLLPVNSFWVSGCGAWQPAAVPANLQLDLRLRGPALQEDWAAWARAWQALDAGPLAALQSGGADVALTLCGERQAVTLAPRPQAWWQAWAPRARRGQAAQLLETL